jgi:hypothetical protein
MQQSFVLEACMGEIRLLGLVEGSIYLALAWPSLGWAKAPPATAKAFAAAPVISEVAISASFLS